MLKSIALVTATLLIGGHAGRESSRAATCRFDAVPEEVRCLLIRVPEVPDDPASRTIVERAVVLAGRGE
jgi:hypothetical protein